MSRGSEFRAVISNKELKIKRTDGFLIGFSDLFVIDDSGSVNLFRVFSTVQTNENLSSLTVETFSRNELAVFGMLDTTKIVMISNFRQTVKHLNYRVQIT